MGNTLVINSDIVKKKSKFFVIRAVTYFSFLLIPVWAQKTQHVNGLVQTCSMVAYILFMLGQWFMLGKEIDHRLKIYYKVNSSIDRVVYRLFIGMFFMILYFNLLSFLPSKWIYNTFWVTWAVLGLFYSWPTRGKIIQESVTTSFSEIKYLDRFEKTLGLLIVVMFFISFPEMPKFTNIEALKLSFDPFEKMAVQFWNFILVNYYPFKNYPDLFRLAWSVHFYYVGLGMFLLIFYALLRYFVSRRLSLLGVFALLSTWSFSKMLAFNVGSSMSMTFSLLWVWSALWITKSSSYRTGLFLGLIGYFGSILNVSYWPLILIHFGLIYFFFLRKKTFWFKRQLMKYSLFGIALTLIVIFSSTNQVDISMISYAKFKNEFLMIINRKGFYTLSYFGIFFIILAIFFPKNRLLEGKKISVEQIYQTILCWSVIFIFGTFFEHSLILSFSLLWPIVLCSLIPIELIFQSTSRLRSRRNMIYLIYIVICLLDSHFEGRVKIFLKLLDM